MILEPRTLATHEPMREDALHGEWELCDTCEVVLVPRTEEYEYELPANDSGVGKAVILLGYRCSRCAKAAS